MSMKRGFAIVAAAAVMAIGFAPAHTAPSESAQDAPGTSTTAIEKANSVLIDAKTGAVLYVGEGDFVPEDAAPGAQPSSQVPR